MEAVALARLPEYQQIAGALKALEVATAVAEDEALLILYGGQAGHRYNSVASQFEADLRNLLRQLLDLRYTFPNRITLAIYSENKRSLFELARSYFKCLNVSKEAH